MTIVSLLSAAVLLSATSFFGPPHITVRPITSNPASVTFELDVEHHTAPEDLTVAGRAEGVRDGRRVSVPLTITRKSVGHFTVARQWDAGVPWVLVFSAEQGPNGSHGVVEGIVLLEANGTVKNIEYTKPGFHESTKKPLRLTSAKIDAALKTLGTTVSPTR